MTYTMSKNYDALYDLLCGGGEALGIGVELPIETRIPIRLFADDGRPSIYGASSWKRFTESPRAFKLECTRLNLEWLAPVDIAEVIEKGDVMHEAMVRYQMDVDDDPPMKHRDMMEAWTTATDKHRTA